MYVCRLDAKLLEDRENFVLHPNTDSERPVQGFILSRDKYLSTQGELDPTATALFVKVKCDGVLAMEPGRRLCGAHVFVDGLVSVGILTYIAEVWSPHWTLYFPSWRS